MATLREHFDTDAKALNAQTEWSLQKTTDTVPVIVIGKISYCFEEYAKYWSFFIPNKADISIVPFLLNMPNVSKCIIAHEEPNQIVGYADSPERHSLESLKFTGRVYLYIDHSLDPILKKEIEDTGLHLGFSIVIRDRSYVDTCSQLSKPVAFISHDSRDKDSLVRELASNLAMKLRKVWYDEFSLNVGDSLRENIERGLKECEKCIVILSPNFISNSGWTKAEFDSIYQREIIEKKLVIVPIWHNITLKEVYDYCPRLTDRFALSSSLGADRLANDLAKVLIT
jgi:hypothetical protein